MINLQAVNFNRFLSELWRALGVPIISFIIFSILIWPIAISIVDSSLPSTPKETATRSANPKSSNTKVNRTTNPTVSSESSQIEESTPDPDKNREHPTKCECQSEHVSPLEAYLRITTKIFSSSNAGDISDLAKSVSIGTFLLMSIIIFITDQLISTIGKILKYWFHKLVQKKKFSEKNSCEFVRQRLPKEKFEYQLDEKSYETDILSAMLRYRSDPKVANTLKAEMDENYEKKVENESLKSYGLSFLMISTITLISFLLFIGLEKFHWNYALIYIGSIVTSIFVVDFAHRNYQNIENQYAFLAIASSMQEKATTKSSEKD